MGFLTFKLNESVSKIVRNIEIRENLSKLEQNLQYRFKNKSLLKLAMNHSSIVKNRIESNERLEFLGDRVLGLMIAQILYQRFPKDLEGDLGYRFDSLVKTDCLAFIAENLQIGDFINLSAGALDSSIQARKRILSNACEAIIAAIFLDGGYRAVFIFVNTHWQY